MKKFKVEATVGCILYSDEENLDQDVYDWIHIDEDEGFIEDFEIIDYDAEEIE